MTQKRRTFTVILEREEDGGYSAYCPSLPGCISQGDDRAEALENIREAVGLVLKVLEDRTAGMDGQDPRTSLPCPETPDLIAGEVRRILENRDSDGLPYEGVSIEQMDVPVAVHS